MAFCKSCGQEIGDAGFCPKCGAAQLATTGSVAAVSAPADSPTAGIEENIAGLLCYLFMWISGLIFLLLDKRPFVKFHAAQSIAFNILAAAIGIVFGIGMWIISMILLALRFPFGFLGFLLWPAIGFCIFLTWVYLMYKAYSHEKFKLPIIGNLVEGMVNK
jgi:uncharacterized membrane protein